MKNRQIAKVAEQVGTSRSTVSKAINHCPGVGDDMREQVLSLAEQEGVRGKRVDTCAVYVILPDTPTFFWRQMLYELVARLSEKGIAAKINVYSRLGDRRVVERYLAEAESLNADILVIAAKYEDLDTRLSAIATRRAVFSLLEVTNAPNVFFFGSDRNRDGRLMATHCLLENPQIKRVLAIGHDPDRLKGFCDGAGSVTLQALEPPLSSTAAELARLIDQTYRAVPFDAVICLDGTTGKVGMALKKCRLSLPLYGFEHPDGDARYLIPSGEVCQDLAVIAEKTACSADNYLKSQALPPSKYSYIPSYYLPKEP